MKGTVKYSWIEMMVSLNSFPKSEKYCYVKEQKQFLKVESSISSNFIKEILDYTFGQKLEFSYR